MSKVLLCLGSNSDAQRHVEAAKSMLRHLLKNIRFTPSVWTEPVGNNASASLYLNCLAEGESSADYPTLHQTLKETEQALGSSPDERKAGVVRIDIDILLADGIRHHEADWDRPYVKSLLGQL